MDAGLTDFHRMKIGTLLIRNNNETEKQEFCQKKSASLSHTFTYITYTKNPRI